MKPFPNVSLNFEDAYAVGNQLWGPSCVLLAEGEKTRPRLPSGLAHVLRVSQASTYSTAKPAVNPTPRAGSRGQ
jgi:hypothetical protein